MTILIIDDEPGLRQTVSLILSEEGYETATASDGAKSLGLLGGRTQIILGLLGLILIVVGLIMLLGGRRQEPERSTEQRSEPLLPVG